MIRFVDNDAWPIDNNLCANAIRPFVVGRRNWLFCDTVAGAQASANLYSHIETCKANGIEPYIYLVALFHQLPLAKTVSESRYFCRKIFSGILLEKIGKNYATTDAFGGPDSSASPRSDPTRGRNLGSRMT